MRRFLLAAMMMGNEVEIDGKKVSQSGWEISTDVDDEYLSQVTAEERKADGKWEQIRPDNHGILLRRTSDQAAGYQSASVAVDGVPAGNWLQPRSNTFHRWLVDTYLVPEFLTAGKNRITIRLVPTPSAPAWSASRYRVETLTGA